MSTISPEYLVKDPHRLDRLHTLGEAPWRLVEESDLGTRGTFYDTFDGSVYLAGATLLWRRSAAEPDLILCGPGGARLEQVVPAEPGFAADLPAGPLRDWLGPVAGVRRLLPAMGIETRTRTLRVLNGDDKTIARLVVETSRYQDPRGGAAGPLGTRLRVLGMRGYDGEAAAILEALAREPGIAPAELPLLLEALEATGRRPADYSSKIDLALDPDMRADLATRRVLRALFDTLEANLEGARANLDTEFLHDLRVATRRIRSALGQVRGVFPQEAVERFKADFAWVQAVTGPVRDLDVYLLEFETYRQGLPPALRRDLEPLRAFLHAHYAAQHRTLVAALDSKRFAHLRRDWRAFLAAPPPPAGTTPQGARSIKRVADRRIWVLAKRVRREGLAIRPDSPAADLHELRKSCKKLRYLMEFFQSLYPREPIRGLIAHLKVLLDNLGAFQDRAVQADHLRDLGRAMLEEDAAGADTLLAMGVVVGQLLAGQQQARGAFAEVFADFLGEEPQQTFATLFNPAPAVDEAP